MKILVIGDSISKQYGPYLYCDHVHFHDSIREKQAAYIAGWLGAFADSGATPQR